MTTLSLAEAAARIRRGELVAYPTETVWGLAADARNEAAVRKLRAWKGRDAEKPMSVLVSDYAALETLGAETTPLAARLAAKFWPGPLTLVVRCEHAFARGVASEDGGVGFRCSPHPVARALAREAGVITATSFNRSGDAACATRADAEACADAQVALVAGEDASGATPSSVVDASGARLRVLREGAIPAHVLGAASSGEMRG
ncbi:MAG: threonylcarbamoyl-AMP synthase [Deltaproteobacteria bacterium]|nr:threonylcarbamoyl-AMP synthase [Deltaproteobacteria bacterium]